MSGEPSTTTAPPVTKETTDVKPRLTPRYRVLIHNDDLTPMDFVVLVLLSVFKKATPEAVDISLHRLRIACPRLGQDRDLAPVYVFQRLGHVGVRSVGVQEA